MISLFKNKLNKERIDLLEEFILTVPRDKQYIYLTLLDLNLKYQKYRLLNLFCFGILFKIINNIEELMDEVYSRNPIESERFYKFYLNII
jgi:hypothetical protein